MSHTNPPELNRLVIVASPSSIAAGKHFDLTLLTETTDKLPLLSLDITHRDGQPTDTTTDVWSIEAASAHPPDFGCFGNLFFFTVRNCSFSPEAAGSEWTVMARLWIHNDAGEMADSVASREFTIKVKEPEPQEQDFDANFDLYEHLRTADSDDADDSSVIVFEFQNNSNASDEMTGSRTQLNERASGGSGDRDDISSAYAGYSPPNDVISDDGQWYNQEP